MRFGGLWWFVPFEALPLILIGGALLVILRVIRPGHLLLLVFGLALLPILAPVVEVLFEILPWWMTLAILLGVTLSFFRAMAALFIGERAADGMVGHLAADALRGLLRLSFGLPVAIVRAVIRRRR